MNCIGNFCNVGLEHHLKCHCGGFPVFIVHRVWQDFYVSMNQLPRASTTGANLVQFDQPILLQLSKVKRTGCRCFANHLRQFGRSHGAFHECVDKFQSHWVRECFQGRTGRLKTRPSSFHASEHIDAECADRGFQLFLCNTR